ncbi:MAG: 23S rRNA (uracil(1939)-C(5))-methyltransferase RlmD [Gammaproteobacteria bacterium]
MGRAVKRQKKMIAAVPAEAVIESLSHDGRGVTHAGGKAVFIDDAMPGETVEFVYTDSRRDYAEGRVLKLLSRSEQRVEARCRHYGVCGGCSFQHVAPGEQIRFKQRLLVEQFARIGKIAIPELWEPLQGPHWGYRHKARLGVKYVVKKEKVLIGFRERRNSFLADIECCDVLYPAVGESLRDIADCIAALSIKEKIPQIEVAVGDAQVALIFRVLQTPSDTDCEILRQFAQRKDFAVYLQPQGPDSIVPLEPEAPALPTYRLPELQISFEFKPTVFTQVNTEINRLMVNRVIDTLQLHENDTVLDLFCGLGNFTLPMARKAGRVVGIEGSPELVALAKHNAILNGIANAEFYSADLTQKISAQPWARQRYNKILLDPSRAGAAEVLPYIKNWRPEIILYVSCNPSTLARDAGILVNDLGYRLLKAGVMDMFPHTAHVESIALFAAKHT